MILNGRTVYPHRSIFKGRNSGFSLGRGKKLSLLRLLTSTPEDTRWSSKLKSRLFLIVSLMLGWEKGSDINWEGCVADREGEDQVWRRQRKNGSICQQENRSRENIQGRFRFSKEKPLVVNWQKSKPYLWSSILILKIGIESAER